MKLYSTYVISISHFLYLKRIIKEKPLRKLASVIAISQCKDKYAKYGEKLNRKLINFNYTNRDICKLFFY